MKAAFTSRPITSYGPTRTSPTVGATVAKGEALWLLARNEPAPSPFAHPGAVYDVRTVLACAAEALAAFVASPTPGPDIDDIGLDVLAAYKVAR